MRHVEQLIRRLHPNRFLIGFWERPHRFLALAITLHILAGWCAIQLASKKASVSASKASVSIGATAPPPANRRVSGSHPIAARKACATHTSSPCCPSLRSGRSAAGDGERGGFSPHPATNGGTRISTPFGPSQRSAPLRCDALALLRSNAPHRSPSLHAAHRLRRLTGRLLPAILLRRCLPSRNTCKLYVDNANMVIDQLSLSTGLPCAGLLCRTRRQRFRTGGPGPMQESHARFARTLRALHAANARRLARGRPGALSQCLHAQQPRLLGYR